jgi:MYXO-CTERM domain-containing protein
MNTSHIALLGAATIAAGAHAGFNGWTAFARSVNGYTVVDVFAATSSSNHKMFNVYDATISTSAAGGFVQGAGTSAKTWKPDLTNFTSTRESTDSFMTVGASRYAGDSNVYAGETTSGDPNFSSVSGAWNATPASLPANTVPTLAGWYSSDPPSSSLVAEDLSLVQGLRLGAAGSHGVWAGHLVIAGTNTQTISWSAYGTVKDLTTGNTDQLLFSQVFTVPAPGAMGLLAVAGVASTRRRRA